MPFNIDIELTNRCNATCHFCPRDETPRQGIMTTAIFSQALQRAVEFREEAAARARDIPDRDDIHAETIVRLCGLGEPLINPHAADFVRQVREAGFECGLSSNAALLDEGKAQALLDAGLQKIYINVSDEGAAYEQVYNLPFQKTRDNVVRFLQMAAGRCDVHMCIVNYRQDTEHTRKLRRYWRDLGITRFLDFDVINRGGALFVDAMQYEQYPERRQAEALLSGIAPKPYCVAPFMFLFIGWDGKYYLCCSDWKKEVPLGSVTDCSLMSVMGKKFDHVTCREPICKKCNHDPVNQVTAELRAAAAGQASHVDAVLETIRRDSPFRELLKHIQ